MSDKIFSTLIHVGLDHLESTVGRGSGRYAYGSGDRAFQRDSGTAGAMAYLKKQGYSESEVAEMLGFESIAAMRKARTSETAKKRVDTYNKIQELYAKGYTRAEISKELNIAESTIRGLEESTAVSTAKKIQESKDALKAQVDAGHYIDVGPGIENGIGVSRVRIDAAIEELKKEGYDVVQIQAEQMGTNDFNKTTISLLVPEGTSVQQVYDEVMKDTEGSIVQIPGTMTNYKTGETNLGVTPPLAIDKSRVLVRYKDDVLPNGKPAETRDGLIEIRPGVADLDMGGSKYTQARIMVKGDPNVNNETEMSKKGYVYAKGMAILSDEVPDGYDVVFNSNKSRSKAYEEVLKPVKDNKDNPFGATVSTLTDDNNKAISGINKVGKNEEGNWGEWSKNLPSQFLSKQPYELVKQQLDTTLDGKKAELEEILAIENVAVRKSRLTEFADACDGNATTLKAAPLPGQQTHVLVPINMPNGRIYAPNYPNGTRVCLVRFPHSGTFEIPELIVDNNNPEGKKFLKNSMDAVGINKATADQLSGADFDGDTALVIPNNDGHVKADKYLKDLVGFDSKSYARAKDDPIITGKSRDGKQGDGFRKQMQMGMISNLITDMTAIGADEEDMAKAVKHSMVIIDAEKHNLDWKQSEKDNDIAAIKAKYRPDGGGASTIVSRSTSPTVVPEVKRFKYQNNTVDSETGEKIFKTTGKIREVETRSNKTVYTNKQGEKYTVTKDENGVNIKSPVVGKTKMVPATTEVSKMEKAFMDGKSAHSLSSGTRKEEAYADFADELHGLANRARKEWVNTPDQKRDPDAAKEYAAEVKSLKEKLDKAEANAPLERKAQLLANAVVRAQLLENPRADWDTKKKWKGQALTAARKKTGAHKDRIKVTEREWDAIMHHAISTSMLTRILANMDSADIAKLSTPKTNAGITLSQEARIKAMLARNIPMGDIASTVGVSLSTVQNVSKS